jgi:hypothetical protein
MTRPMTRRALASSVDALVAGAKQRTPLQSVDSKSGARFEQIERDGDLFVLKHIDRRDDWIMRQTGDLGCVPILVWESGVLDLVPDCVDHTTVGAARDGSGGAVLMRFVEGMVPPDGTPLPLDQHLRFLDHLARCHAATLGWRDDIGLVPLANRYSFFGPDALAYEAARPDPHPVPLVAIEGWQRLPEVAPDLDALLAPLRRAPWELFDALGCTPHAFLHGDWKAANLGSTTDGRTLLVDWSQCGEGPPVTELMHYVALNIGRFPPGHTKDDAIVTYRDALTRHGVDTASWWDEQLALCTVGVMLQLAWEKAFDEDGAELAWWQKRTLAAARTLGL